MNDYPQVDHPWNGTEGGHNCESCEPDSIWKCDPMSHLAADLKEAQKQATPVLQEMQRTRRRALDASLHKGLA